MPTVAITGQTTFGANTSGTTTQLDNNFLLAYNALNNFNQYTNYLVDSGAANAYVVTAPASTTLTLAAGLIIQFKAATANTTASTLNANGTGVKNILNIDGGALSAGQIPLNGIVSVIYDGTQFILQTPAVTEGSWTPTLVGTGGGPLTYTTQVGRYIRQGNLVTIWALVVIAGGVGITGNVSIGGLPFTASTITNYIASLAVGGWVFTLDAGYTQVAAIIASGGTTIQIFECGTAKVIATVPAASVGAGVTIEVSGTYRIN